MRAEVPEAQAISRAEILRSLSARHFVEVRTIAGGPALEALEPEIERARGRLSKDTAWLGARREALEQAHAELERQCRALLVREGLAAPEPQHAATR